MIDLFINAQLDFEFSGDPRIVMARIDQFYGRDDGRLTDATVEALLSVYAVAQNEAVGEQLHWSGYYF